MHRSILAVGVIALLAACSRDAAAPTSYAEDRALVENLYARYVFAADWKDADTYASLFTEDGVLDWARGVAEGREAIRSEARARAFWVEFDNRNPERKAYSGA